MRTDAPHPVTPGGIALSVLLSGVVLLAGLPSFLRLQLRSRTAEARTVLGEIAVAQELFRAEHDAYVEAGPNPGVGLRTTKEPWGDLPCPVGCDRSNPALCTELSCLGYRASADVYYEYATRVRSGVPPDYTATAEGDLDGDRSPGGFVFCTHNAEGGAEPKHCEVAGLWQAGPRSCPAFNAICAGEIFDCDPSAW